MQGGDVVAGEVEFCGPRQQCFDGEIEHLQVRRRLCLARRAAKFLVQFVAPIGEVGVQGVGRVDAGPGCPHPIPYVLAGGFYERQFARGALHERAAFPAQAAVQGSGVGRRIVEALMARASRLGVREVFALTRRPDFFERLGFSVADKDRFPQKIWVDCERCPRRDACDEIAVHQLIGV